MPFTLIISREGDASTSDVIDWIHYFNKKIIRINNNSKFILNEIKLESNNIFIRFQLDGKTYTSDKIKSFWYRRGDINFKMKLKPYQIDESYYKQIIKHLDYELSTLKDAIHIIFQEKKHISSKEFASINKLEALILAQKIGLHIPNSIVCNQKNDLQLFFNKEEKIITKSLSVGLNCETKNKNNDIEQYGTYTSEVKNDFMKNIPNNFFFSFSQKKLDKAFEIRIFMFDNRFFSMAIFSQNNPNTAIDFRIYDFKLPNRNVPFKLPEIIEHKLKLLMKELKLNSGSIDMVVTKEGEYVFLEINPIGQFGMVSYPCNYFIEKKIGVYLTN